MQKKPTMTSSYGWKQPADMQQCFHKCFHGSDHENLAGSHNRSDPMETLQHVSTIFQRVSMMLQCHLLLRGTKKIAPDFGGIQA